MPLPQKNILDIIKREVVWDNEPYRETELTGGGRSLSQFGQAYIGSVRYTVVLISSKYATKLIAYRVTKAGKLRRFVEVFTEAPFCPLNSLLDCNQ